MKRLTRAGTVVLGLVLAGSSAAQAQNYGMPLFTNPRYSTGLRLHADAGQPSDALRLPDSTTANVTVLQIGASLALGPLGINAAVAANQADVERCGGNQSDCQIDDALSAGVLAQLRLAGGGRQNLSLSLFGGASTDINAYDVAGVAQPKLLNIPVGVAIGLRIPLGVASLNIWGAPRMNFSKYVGCDTQQQPLFCDLEAVREFRWAVGADFPILRIFSIRAAFDAGKDASGQSNNFVGLGVSLGLGGMR